MLRAGCADGTFCARDLAGASEVVPCRPKTCARKSDPMASARAVALPDPALGEPAVSDIGVEQRSSSPSSFFPSPYFLSLQQILWRSVVVVRMHAVRGTLYGTVRVYIIILVLVHCTSRNYCTSDTSTIRVYMYTYTTRTQTMVTLYN